MYLEYGEYDWWVSVNTFPWVTTCDVVMYFGFLLERELAYDLQQNSQIAFQNVLQLWRSNYCFS